MLIGPKSYLYSYAITRDFGFAPNPFHGVCTLATCKPDIRAGANVEDWVLGIGGSNIRGASRKCIFLMKVTEKIGFQEYWDDPRYSLKKPLRNGSRVQMLGDNIYHYDDGGHWIQEDSHHSNPDGTPNALNLTRDTRKSDCVLVSNQFLYFGREAIPIDLEAIGYHRIRNFKKTNLTESEKGRALIATLIKSNQSMLNMVIADPWQFQDSHKRADQDTGKIF